MKTLTTGFLRRRLLAAGWACLLFAGLPLRTPAAEFNEYAVKAVFLFNFAQFVEWPPAAFANAEAPLVIGILGNDPFGKHLEDTVQGETVKNRKIIIKHKQRSDDVTDCHLLFICQSEKPRLKEVLAALREKNILTVSDIDQFSRHGGMINLLLEGDKVRFEVNLKAAEQGGLKISSKLLKLGKVVSMDHRQPTG